MFTYGHGELLPPGTRAGDWPLSELRATSLHNFTSVKASLLRGSAHTLFPLAGAVLFLFLVLARPMSQPVAMLPGSSTILGAELCPGQGAALSHCSLFKDAHHRERPQADLDEPR